MFKGDGCIFQAGWLPWTFFAIHHVLLLSEVWAQMAASVCVLYHHWIMRKHAQIILGHSMYHNAKSLSKCSLQKTSPINYFYIHAFNLLFSEEEICFKLPSLFRLRVAWNYSRNFRIRLLYRHHGRPDVKMWSELKYLFRCNLSKRHVVTAHLGKVLLHGSPL